MKRGSSFVLWTLVLMAVLVMVSPSAYGQSGGASAALSGVVIDNSGGVMPGVDVVAKNNATGTLSQAVTDGLGRFVIPALQPGTYTVTVTLTGFKTVVLPDIQMATATPQFVRVTLELGKIEETVVVTGAAEIVQTQSAVVQTTIAVTQLQQLPVITHTALDAIVSLPGVETSGSNTRGSTINGLPTSAINITLDGINVQDKRGSEGFFMYIRPMMDSVEEITVSTSTPEAAASGAGGANIAMQTRAGSNRFSGSVYNTWRNQAGVSDDDVIARTKKAGWLWRLNTPYWFNKRDLPKTAAGEYFINDTRLTTPGFRVGGPVLKDKLFYFFNAEWFLLPESRSRTRYLLNETARAGILTYPAVDGSGNKTINVYDVATSKSQVNTPDLSIAKLLLDIRQATATEGATKVYDLNTDQYDYVPSATQKRIFPTLRIDYNLTSAHRVTFSTRYNDFNSTPDFLNSAESRFPGFPNLAGQVSGRYMWQGTVRSTIGRNMVNEARVGTQNSIGLGTYFGKGVDPSQFNCTGIGCQSAGGKGWSWGFPSVGGQGQTGATAYNGASAGVASQFSVENTLTWLKGKHSLSMGGAFSRTAMRNWNSTPTYSSLGFGTTSLDKVAYEMLDPTLNPTAFPGGATNTYRDYARNLYGLLTGRVTSFSGTAYLGSDGKYHFQGDRTNSTTGDDFGFYVSDAWRLKPNLTLTAGVRYQLQLPMTSDGMYSRPDTWQMVYGATGAGTGSIGQGNLYHPGTLTGTAPFLVPYENNRPAYNTDYNNIAPSVGVAWRPNLKASFLTKILGTDPVFRGGYALTYTRLGTAFFDSNYAGNPGRSRSASRGTTTGTPMLGQDVVGGPQVFPVLLRDTSRLFPSTFPDSPAYPIYPAVNESVDIHYPDWPVPSTHQYSFGFQRELGKSMAIDIRYVGNTNVGGWSSWNMTSSAQWSMLAGENGFYDEFRKAQGNLRANILANAAGTIDPLTGKVYTANSFAYSGAPGTSPLPIFQAFFAGVPLTNAANQVAANYTHANYKTSSWYNSLNMYSPSLTGISGTGTSGLQNDAFLANAALAALPLNFFQANPALKQGSAYLETTSGNTRYNSLQIELRRRMTQGLVVSSSYQFSFGRQTWTQRSLREDWFYIPSTGGPIHSLKINWVYELPFGHGKPIGNGVSRWMDKVIGGWEIDGVGRIQTGPIFNFGGYRLVGMTEEDLQAMFKMYSLTDSAGKEHLYMLPQDVIANSILALSTSSATTATGYAGALPTGRYLAPSSSPDCVQYMTAQCPGTTFVRKINGPIYWKFDMSFQKRIAVYKNMRVELRMDLFNIFDTINFNAVGVGGSSLSSWEITSAATDVSASQDPGGRITSFGLRFSW
jgi:hypothetical protein